MNKTNKTLVYLIKLFDEKICLLHAHTKMTGHRAQAVPLYGHREAVFV